MTRPERRAGFSPVSLRALRFLTVGGSATALQYGLLVLLVEWIGAGEMLAVIAAYVLAAIANYLLNFYFTFSARGVVEHGQALPRFAFVALAGLILNTLCFSLLLPFAHYLLAQGFATAVTLIFNFLLHQLWTYRTSP